MDSTTILGCKVSIITLLELNNYIISKVRENVKEAVLNVNINCINLAQKYDWIKVLLKNTNIVFCDGDGVRLGASILGAHLPEKITYNRWIWELADVSSNNDISWYLFGGSDKVVNDSYFILKSKFPKLNVLGCRSGYFDDKKDSETIITQINKVKPNILILGMGMPKQEKWIIDNFDKLEVNIILTGGAVFDYISGKAKMTPDIFYKYKLEWLYRFIQDPKRLFKRYIIGNPLFIARIILEKYRIINYDTR